MLMEIFMWMEVPASIGASFLFSERKDVKWDVPGFFGFGIGTVR